jgi:hypothetical protein
MTDDQFQIINAQLERIAHALENQKAKQSRPPREPATDGGALKLMELWNLHRNVLLPKVQGLGPTSTRYKNAVSRWADKPDGVYWISVINRINNSKFCNGDNERRWLADFEFLVRPDVHYRVLEGKFDIIGLSQKAGRKSHETRVIGRTEDGEDVYG